MGTWTMRQPKAKQVGAKGETAAKLLFEEMGCGPVGAGEHDLGTDLFVQLRDATGADLGLLLGVQVKTGDSFFKRRATVGGRTGWWYAETPTKKRPTHKGYWLNHVVPHILLLQTEDFSRRAWVPLSSETIEDTGKGIRVFVPDQALTATSTNDLIRVAGSARTRPAFEGENWRFSIEDLDASQHARYSMILPRLVEPHRNRGTTASLHWAEAVAICIRADPERWSRYASGHEDVPSPEEAKQSADPGWRLASGIYEWVTSGSTQRLADLDPDSLPDSIRAARAVALASAWMLGDKSQDAMRLLESELARAVAPSDRAWMQVHLARVHSEVGDIEGGASLVSEAQRAIAAGQIDATTSAIQAAAVWAQFETTSFFDRDLASVVTALDTTASWWIAESTASGLTEAAKEQFRAWSRDRSVRFGGKARIHNELMAAELSAQLAGNHGSWRSHAALRAIVDLTVYPDAEIGYVQGLDTLRRSGDDSNLKLSLDRLRQTGPSSPVVELVGCVDLATSTRTSIVADLAALATAGAYCTEENALSLTDRLLQELEGRSSAIAALGAQIDRVPKIIDALIGLHAHFTSEHWGRIVDWVGGLASDTREITGSAVQRLTAGTPPLSESQRTLLRERVLLLPPDGWLSKVLTNILGAGDEQARPVLAGRLAGGDLSALSGYPDLSELNAAETAALRTWVETRVAEITANANPGVYAKHGYDVPLLCAQLSCLHPTEADWHLLADFLSAPDVLLQQKRTAAKLLAANSNDVPVAARALVTDAARQARAVGNSIVSPFDPPIGGALIELELSLGDTEPQVQRQLRTTLLTGSASERQDLADYLALTAELTDDDVLLALIGDIDDDVRQHALTSLTRRLAQRAGSDLSALEHALSEGELAARAVLRGLFAVPTIPPSARMLVDRILDHPSAAIRRVAQNWRVRSE